MHVYEKLTGREISFQKSQTIDHLRNNVLPEIYGLKSANVNPITMNKSGCPFKTSINVSVSVSPHVAKLRHGGWSLLLYTSELKKKNCLFFLAR